MIRRRGFGTLLLAAAAYLPAAALAEPTPALAASCYGCHAPPGESAGAPVSTNGFRQLGDLPAEEIATRLKLYKSGALSGTLMNRIARGYSDSELETLAAHFGRAEP